MKTKIDIVPSERGDITLYTLTNEQGAQVRLSSVGAGIVSIVVPDRDGHLADVALGYANPVDYFYDGPCAGKTPGRYANRIARGRFFLDGESFQLNINNGPNALHGGPEGFAQKIWECDMEGDTVVFTLDSPDGDEHYPGNLQARVAYTWTEENVLKIELSAVTDRKTVVNLTNHTYFNLAGEGSGTVLDHELQLNCSRYLPTDDTLIPTGEMAPVAGTPMDFMQPKRLGQDIKQDFPALNYGKGYDNCWVIDDAEGQVRLAAVQAAECLRCLPTSLPHRSTPATGLPGRQCARVDAPTMTTTAWPSNVRACPTLRITPISPRRYWMPTRTTAG